jgi:hypothetical protein
MVDRLGGWTGTPQTISSRYTSRLPPSRHAVDLVEIWLLLQQPATLQTGSHAFEDRHCLAIHPSSASDEQLTGGRNSRAPHAAPRVCCLLLDSGAAHARWPPRSSSIRRPRQPRHQRSGWTTACRTSAGTTPSTPTTPWTAAQRCSTLSSARVSTPPATTTRRGGGGWTPRMRHT